MFEGLRKKFSDFIGSVAKKEKDSVKEEQKAERIEAPHDVEKVLTVKESAKEEVVQRAKEEKPVHVQEKKVGPVSVPVEKPEEKQEHHAVAKVHAPKEQAPAKPKVSLETKLKGMILGSVTIKEKDVSEYLETLKISLLQSDVRYEVAEKLVDSLHDQLVDRSVKSKEIGSAINESVRNSFFSVLAKSSSTDIGRLAAAKKGRGADMPFRILFIGPNGAGKTTTMAKFAHMLMQQGLTCMISASDTFRAAAVEQAVFHANKLGIGVVKGAYGADPASVAYAAVAYAKAHGIDVVLIDSAGRQETNKNLIEEIKKMVRIAKPDFKLFVGESISGNSLLDQVREFHSAVSIDGIVLTKLDCDARGGNTISILSETSIPVLFFGTGEAYTDLMPYDASFIVDSIVPKTS